VQPIFKILLRVAVIAGIVLVVAGTISVFVPKYRQMCGLENRCSMLRSCVDGKLSNIHRIKENVIRLNSDPEFVARIAHQNRRVFPNELVFVFDDK